MQSLSDLLWSLGPWNWFIVGVAMFILETIVPGVHFLWFGLAAIIIGILALALGLAWPVQLIGFAVISVATVFLVRRYARPDSAKSDTPDLNIRGAQYLGRVVTVEQAIVSGRGKVRVGDTLWHAEGEDTAAGSKVKVVGVNGTALVVAALD